MPLQPPHYPRRTNSRPSVNTAAYLIPLLLKLSQPYLRQAHSFLSPAFPHVAWPSPPDPLHSTGHPTWPSFTLPHFLQCGGNAVGASSHQASQAASSPNKLHYQPNKLHRHQISWTVTKCIRWEQRLESCVGFVTTGTPQETGPLDHTS